MQFITAEIMGGLGNQLFQIFTLLAYIFRQKIPFYFSTEPIHHGQRKKTYWDTPLLEPLKEFVKTPPLQAPPQIIREQNFHYQPLLVLSDEHIKLFGYFQSFKYFEDQKSSIFQLLKMDETQAAMKENTNNTYDYENTIAVHFRVGDYVQLQAYHPLMTLEYYTAALNQFLKDQAQAEAEAEAEAAAQAAAQAEAEAEAEAAAQAAAQAQAPADAEAPTPAKLWQLLYFCEENDQSYVESQMIKKLQENPDFKDKFIFKCIDHQLSDWEQMIVMSICKHQVIANSSFSWWGAYLSSCRERVQSKVYYPTTWFGRSMCHKNMSDLFPPHWSKINV
jgi:hypothetical protein